MRLLQDMWQLELKIVSYRPGPAAFVEASEAPLLILYNKNHEKMPSFKNISQIGVAQLQCMLYKILITKVYTYSPRCEFDQSRPTSHPSRTLRHAFPQQFPSMHIIVIINIILIYISQH